MPRGIALFCLAALVFEPAAFGNAQGPSDVDPDTEIARRHFERGTELYGVGRYAEAVGEFESARRAKPLPAFDFNIARAHDRMEHAREAIDAYERYLAAVPNAPDAGEVRARIAVLRGRLGTTPSTIALEAPRPLPPRRRMLTWALGGTGAALLVGSLAAGLVAHARYGALSGECAADGACFLQTAPDAQGLIDGGHTAALTADILLGVGLVAITAGLVMFFVERQHPVELRAWRTMVSGAAFAWGRP